METLLNAPVFEWLESQEPKVADRVARALDMLAAEATAGDPRKKSDEVRQVSRNPDIYEFYYGSARLPFVVEKTSDGEEVLLVLTIRWLEHEDVERVPPSDDAK